MSETVSVGAQSNTTTYVSEAVWRGVTVMVSSDAPCSIPGHALEVMHHIGEDGLHYCPTMFLWCGNCAGVASEPEPFSCQKWQQP